MKKITSTALLAIRLTWKMALAGFLFPIAIQTFAVYRWLMPGGVPLQTTFGYETMLASAVGPYGQFFAAGLLLLLAVCAGLSKGSKTVYTMNRLGLTEMQTTLVFGGVFSLYFLIYWALQIGLCYAYFAWYTRFGLVSSNAWMLSCWRSEWLHTLLPLAEWWGYLRNLTICLSFGFTAAFGSRLLRRGKFPFAVLVPPVLSLFLLSGRIGTFGTDLLLAVLLIAITAGFFFSVEGGCENEDL